jgi:hypothetical protein
MAISWATYQHPVLQPIFNQPPSEILIVIFQQGFAGSGKTLLAVACSRIQTSMPFPSVERPNLEAAQPALALLQERSPVWDYNVVVVTGSTRSTIAMQEMNKRRAVLFLRGVCMSSDFRVLLGFHLHNSGPSRLVMRWWRALAYRWLSYSG